MVCALIIWAEELNEIKTICHCGRKATMNVRVDGDGNVVKQGSQVFIGGNESYVSTCRLHFKQGDSGQ
jgi:thymidine kinase